jgi:hypothetical protein
MIFIASTENVPLKRTYALVKAQFYARSTKWANVTATSSTLEAVRTAYKFFGDPYWRGPKPTPETAF